MCSTPQALDREFDRATNAWCLGLMVVGRNQVRNIANDKEFPGVGVGEHGRIDGNRSRK